MNVLLHSFVILMVPVFSSQSSCTHNSRHDRTSGNLERNKFGEFGTDLNVVCQICCCFIGNRPKQEIKICQTCSILDTNFNMCKCCTATSQVYAWV